MKIFFLLVFILVINLYASAQEEAYFVNWTTEQADSVMNVLSKSANDTLRMKMARSLGIEGNTVFRVKR